MKQIFAFLKTKGFYIALGTGIVAFAGLIAMYDYKSDRASEKNEQAIDLNQPVQSEELAKDEELEVEKNKVEQTTGPNIKTTEQCQDEKNDETKSDLAKLAGESDATKKDIEATSGAVVPEVDEVILDYDGSQVLAWPIVGNIVLPYSMDQTIYFKTLNCYRCNPGIMIEGEEDSPVYSVYDGVVLSVEESKEFGTTVILDLGNGYHATYGQLKNVAVKAGDKVCKAQSIGEIAKVSPYYLEEGDHLYFAMTKDDEPVDPTYYMQ